VTVPDNALAIADTNGLQAALDAKAPLASPTFTGTVVLPAVTQSGNITANGVTVTPTELGYVGSLTSDAQNQINAKANSASPTLSNPTFTGTVTVPDNALAIADVSGLSAALATIPTIPLQVENASVTIQSGANILDFAGTLFVVTQTDADPYYEAAIAPNTQAANPDTSGATLAALETEVNQIKAALRALGLIAT
jgi:hypothetical protein